MKSKKGAAIISYILTFVFLGLLIGTNVSAATTGDVAATVTVQSIALTVADGTVAYGTLAAGDSAGTNGTDLQTVTNTGNVAEDFTIKGTNSANWTLDSTNVTSDHYIHKFCTATCASAPTNYTALTTSNAALGAGNVAASGTQTFDLYVTTPATSTVTTAQSVNVTVTASAH